MLPFDPRDVPLPLFARATNPQVPNSASASENLDAIRHAANMVRLYKGRYPSGYRFEHPRSYERYLVIAADSPFEKDADKLITSVDKEGHAGPVEGATQQSHGHGGEGITGEPVVNPFLGPENAEPAHIFSTHPEQLSFWSGKVRIPRTAIPNVNNAQIPDVASTGEPTHKKKKRGKRSKKRKAAHKPSEIEVEESNNDRAENKEAKDESHAEKADPEALQDNEIVEPGRLVEPPDIEFIANVVSSIFAIMRFRCQVY